MKHDSKNFYKRIIFIGPPGSGKGTQAEIISKKIRVPHISTGDIFRKIINSKTKLGRVIKSYVEKGTLVPDKIVFSAVKSALPRKGFLLDGFPRNVNQAILLEKFLNKHSPIQKVIYFKITDKEVIKRLTSRRTCPSCGKNYNIYTLKPQIDELCDICKTKLIIRNDDKLSTVKKRLQVYKKDTKPLIDYYKKRMLLSKIDANNSVEVITKNIYEILCNT